MRFEVYCRGNLVAKCATADEGSKVIEKNETDDAPADVWEVKDTAADDDVESIIEGPKTPRDDQRKPYVAPKLRELGPEEIAKLKKPKGSTK